MKTVTIAETQNGFLVISGELGYTEKPKELFERTSSFNSLDKAISHIRSTIKAWDKKQTKNPPVA